jgi:hypothetical protein
MSCSPRWIRSNSDDGYLGTLGKPPMIRRGKIRQQSWLMVDGGYVGALDGYDAHS